MNNTDGTRNTEDSIAAIFAGGMTYSKFGLMMAEEIFKRYPVNTGERRRVVIMFTDGETDAVTGNVEESLNFAAQLKDMEAMVYTVGVIEGADPMQDPPADMNDFMHRISSNYGADKQPAISTFPPTRVDESYCLAADDEESLRNVFESIAGEISVGRSDSTLNYEAVIKDIITEQFNPPTEAEITLSTADCTGVDAEGKPSAWAAAAADSAVTATVTGNTVSLRALIIPKTGAARKAEPYAAKSLLLNSM